VLARIPPQAISSPGLTPGDERRPAKYMAADKCQNENCRVRFPLFDQNDIIVYTHNGFPWGGKMHRMIKILFFFVLCPIILYSQTIEVNQPAEGSVFCNTDAILITWAKTGSQGNAVKISLYDEPRWPDAKPRLAITSAAQNNGFYLAPAGTFKNLPARDYKIVIKVKNEQVGGQSGTITIKDCLKSPQNIDVVSPHAGSAWKRGVQYNIEWNNQFTRNKKTTIQLVKHPGGQLIKDIATVHYLLVPTASSISQHPWTVPMDLGGSYRIKIFISDQTARGVSSVFNVPMETNTVTYYPPLSAENAEKYFNWRESKGPLDLFFPYPDPGPMKMRVGFANRQSNNGIYVHVVYRSLLNVDIDAYKNKGFLLKATLIFNIDNTYTVPAACSPGISLYIPEEKGNIFLMKISKHSDIKDVTVIVRDWLLDRKPNYGLLFVGPNELGQKNNDGCVSYSDEVRLELQFLQKAN
jgi:hypothetical protein